MDQALNHPHYDPLWEVCQDLDIPVSSHGGTGSPEYARTPSSALMQISEVPFYSLRPLQSLLLGGVFERFPRLKFVVTEAGTAWVPSILQRLDHLLASVRKNGRMGELRFAEDTILPLSASEYFDRNVWIGSSQPGPADAAVAMERGTDHFMWGSDYPHDEGTAPYTREHLRQLFHDTPTDKLRAFLGGNAAKLYGFDLAKLAPLAEKHGPTVEELKVPLDQLPEHPNEALLKAVAS